LTIRNYTILGSRADKAIDSGREEEEVDYNVGYLLEDMKIRHCFFYKEEKEENKLFYLNTGIYIVMVR
jgi:hypothetical protein